MILPEDLEKSGSSSTYISRPSSTIYLLLPYIWWQLDDFFIGQARTAGLSTDFKLAQIDSEELYTDTKFVLFAFAWLLLLWQISNINIHKMILIVVSLQTLLVLAQIGASSTEVLLTIRSMLGIGGAIFPGSLLLSISQFPRSKLTTIVAIFVAVSPAEIVVAGPLLSALVSFMKDTSILSWQAISAIDGILGIIVVAMLWLKFPISIEDSFPTKFMNSLDSTSWKSKFKDLFDPKNIIFAIMFICTNLATAPAPCYLAVHHRISFVSMPYFFFTVISDLAPSSHLIFNLLTIIPYLVSIITIFILARKSDKKQVRGSFVFACGLLSATGFAIMSLVAILDWNIWWSFFAIFPACVGSYGAMTMILSWALGSEQSAFGRGILLAVLVGAAQLSVIFSPAGVKPWWRAEDEPAHPRGLGASAALMGLCAILALFLRSYLTWRNSNKERHLYTPVKAGDALDDEVEEEIVDRYII
ncbi:uncharacterized protein EAE97_003970 [Botrytis byssoidea]|uniref:Major facilitator superfamily (MFS) profile domain-containing protein n=1 Tax=Botrytis byssoidea TaxID=139641 RepID=A0A9P5IP13_9HELO|nr:uncharacterized protein EAE97_003970 [Botrytis byssoidea]KAF7948559.1 hypothetical protein EAE97_003970 [Botrytis byssoidea]